MSEGQRTGGIRRVLSKPAAYSLLQRAVGADRSRKLLVSRHIRPAEGTRILDIGCGTGELLDALPPVDYLGFDLNPQYVTAAQQRYGHRGRFVCADVRAADLSGEQPFDLVLAVGLLHHLDDAGVGRLLSLAASMLAPDGRMVTFDGVFVPGQPRVARWMLQRDRGEEVRDVAGYTHLFEPYFTRVTHTVSTDFLHVPYTHLVIEAGAARES